MIKFSSFFTGFKTFIIKCKVTHVTKQMLSVSHFQWGKSLLNTLNTRLGTLVFTSHAEEWGSRPGHVIPKIIIKMVQTASFLSTQGLG